MWPRLGFLVIGLLLSVALINPAGAQDAAELGRIFDAYNVAAKAGDVDKMLALRTAEQQKEIRGQIGKKEDRNYFLLLGRAQIPESYQIEHVSWAKSGQKCDALYARAVCRHGRNPDGRACAWKSRFRLKKKMAGKLTGPAPGRPGQSQAPQRSDPGPQRRQNERHRGNRRPHGQNRV